MTGRRIAAWPWGAEMGRRARSAFTLMELLVVVTIMGILLAMLVPGVTAGWQMALSVTCQRNLNAIYQAQATWRSDRGDGLILSGRSWPGRLLPYVEANESVFQCPGSPLRENPVAGLEAGPPSEADVPYPSGPGSERNDGALEFNIYWQQGSYGDVVSWSGIRGALAWTIPLDSHPWVRRTDQGSSVLYEVDDEGSTGGVGRPITFDDIRFEIAYEDGKPVRLTIMQAPCRTSMYGKYMCDLLVNGEVMVRDWVTHTGESFDLRTQDVKGDYGLSVGTYARPDATVSSIDPKLFFILDYAKPIASYAGYGTDGDEGKWDKYFIEDPDDWRHEWGGGGEDWRQYQSLRHFGMANVLFCDGHVESRGPADLRQDNPLWRYTGR